jgi:hypothetical protein
MRRVVLVLFVFALLQPALATGQLGEGLREEIKVREDLLTRQFRDLAEMREKFREIWTRVEQLTGGLLQAQQDGETVESLRLRDDDLRKAETELLAAMFQAQQARSAILEIGR